MENITNFVRKRKTNHGQKLKIWNGDFINRLGVSTVLKGHNGCVNCLEWSRDGSVLISGSDDLTVNLWRPFASPNPDEEIPESYEHARVLSPFASLPTPHQANIFGVKFLRDEELVATCAADGVVFVIDVETNQIRHQYSHSGRVKRIATACPNTFYTACEDGTLYQIDIRENSSDGMREAIKFPEVVQVRPAMFRSSPDNVLSQPEIKCVDVHSESCKIAIGSNSSVVKVFDIRASFQNGELFCPGHLAVNGRHCITCTDVRFSSDGKELLANLGQDNIYIFNMKQPQHTTVKLTEPSSNSAAQNLPTLPAKLESLKQLGNESFREQDFFHAEQVYSDALYHARTHPVLLSNCAAALSRRNYVGDVFESFRHSQRALRSAPNYRKCRLRAIKSLEDMKLLQAARDEYQVLLEYDIQHSSAKEVQMIKEKIGKLQLQLDSAEGDESDALDQVGKINTLKQYRDYERRFVGHSNCQTDIKEASFVGSDYVAAGSDCGNMFIWHRSGRLVFLGKGDGDIVNCIAPNRFLSAIASSGIDSEIKLWQPVDESEADAFTLETHSTFFSEQCEKNQLTLKQFVSNPIDFFDQMGDQFFENGPECRPQ